MTLRWRLLAAQGILALALLAVGVVAVTSLRTLGRSAETILQDNYRSVLAAQRIKEAAERLDSAALYRVAGTRSTGPGSRSGPASASSRRSWRSRRATSPSAGEREATARLRLAWKAYQDAFTAARAAARPRGALAPAYFDDARAPLRRRSRRRPRRSSTSTRTPWSARPSGPAARPPT